VCFHGLDVPTDVVNPGIDFSDLLIRAFLLPGKLIARRSCWSAMRPTMPVKPMMASAIRSVLAVSFPKSAAKCACCASRNCIVRCISSGDIGSNSTGPPPSPCVNAIMASSIRRPVEHSA